MKKNIYSFQKNGVIGVFEDSVLILNGTTFQNVSAKDGAIIYAFSNEKTSIIIYNVIVSMSESRTGSLFYFYVCPQVVLRDFLFISIKGNIIRSLESNITVVKTSFSKVNCKDIAAPGCIISASSKSTIFLLDSRVENIIHNMPGGIAYAIDSKVIIERVSFEGLSVSTPKGGACFKIERSQLSVLDGLFTDFKIGKSYYNQPALNLVATQNRLHSCCFFFNEHHRLSLFSEAALRPTCRGRIYYLDLLISPRCNRLHF